MRVKYFHGSKELIGRKFGRLKVISEIIREEKDNRTIPKVKVVCECGNESVVSVFKLNSGHTKSCGCLLKTPTFFRESLWTCEFIGFGETKTLLEWIKDSRRLVDEDVVYNRIKTNKWTIERALTQLKQDKNIDLTGKKFLRLTVIERNINSDNYGNKTWKCLCSCGNLTFPSTHALTSGKALSCGCYIAELARERMSKRRLNDGVACRNAILGSYKNGAKEKGIEWLLPENKFIELINGNCYYCGQEPSQIRKYPNSNGSYTYNGIDRLNSDESYFAENCVSCCKHCNYMKIDYTEEEFLNKVKQIYEFKKL